jgi:small subunit ribosomal protein S17
VSPKKPKAQAPAPARKHRRAPAETPAPADTIAPAPAPAAVPAQAEGQVQPGAAAAAAAPRPAQEAKGVRTLTGRVVSNKMHKTIAVEIERLIRHPRYGKFIRRTTKLLAHDEAGASHEGDLVTIVPCRPVSRHKSWRLLAVVSKAAGR